MSGQRSARPLLLVALVLVVAAALLWGAAGLSWPVPGAVPAWPTGLAWLAVAGIAGVSATSGIARRLVGGLLAVVGIGALAGAVTAAAAPGTAAGPWIALAGAVALAAAGGFVAFAEPRLARFGARYARRPADVDPDRAAWQELDAGRDPTA